MALGETYDWVKQANAELEEQVWQDTNKTHTPLQAEEAARKAEAELKTSWWDKNGKFTIDTAGNILNLVTGAIVAANGTYDPGSVYTDNGGILTQAPMMYRRSSGMSATTKIVLFGALGAAIIVGAVLYKKSKRKKRREEREREREEEYEYHRRTSKRRRR